MLSLSSNDGVDWTTPSQLILVTDFFPSSKHSGSSVFRLKGRGTSRSALYHKAQRLSVEAVCLQCPAKEYVHRPFGDKQGKLHRLFNKIFRNTKIIRYVEN